MNTKVVLVMLALILIVVSTGYVMYLNVPMMSLLWGAFLVSVILVSIDIKQKWEQ